MDERLLFGAATALFCVRDARLLRSKPGLVWATVPVTVFFAACCGLAAERLSLADAETWRQDWRLWIPATLTHFLLGLVALRSASPNRAALWQVLMPPPVSLVAATGAARLILAQTDGVTGAPVGLGLGLAYLAAVGAVTTLLRRTDSLTQTLRYASTTHISAVLLLPVATVLDRPVLAQPIDWPVTGAVLAGIAAVLAASFAWHRARR